MSSSAEARSLSGELQGEVPTEVRSERAHVFEIGASARLGSHAQLSAVAYGKLIDDFIVKAELGTSGIIFPVNLKKGIVAGGELVASLRWWHSLSALLSVTSGAALGVVPSDGSSPIAAGLIVGEEGSSYAHPFSGEDLFPTEHSQLLAAALQIRYDLPIGAFVMLHGRFDSGLPFDLLGPNGEGLDEAASRAELHRRGYRDDVIDLLNLTMEAPGSPDKSVAAHATFDLGAGIALAELTGVNARLSTMVINVLDTPYLYKFESSLGATHFGVPRSFTITAELQL